MLSFFPCCHICITSFTSCFSAESESLLGFATIIAGHDSGALNHAGPLIHFSCACKLLPPRLLMSAGFSSVGTYLQVYFFLYIFLTRFDTNCLYLAPSWSQCRHTFESVHAWIAVTGYCARALTVFSYEFLVILHPTSSNLWMVRSRFASLDLSMRKPWVTSPCLTTAYTVAQHPETLVSENPCSSIEVISYFLFGMLLGSTISVGKDSSHFPHRLFRSFGSSLFDGTFVSHMSRRSILLSTTKVMQFP